jgi:hypothetical protein
MIFKTVARKNPLPFGGPVVHLTATAPSPTGPFRVHTAPIFTLSGADFPAEDPFLFYRDGLYHLLMKDMDRHFSPVQRALLHAQSPDGFHWDTEACTVFSDRRVATPEGLVRYHRLERPQLFIDVDGRPVFTAAALDEGTTSCLCFPLKEDAFTLRDKGQA